MPGQAHPPSPAPADWAEVAATTALRAGAGAAQGLRTSSCHEEGTGRALGASRVRMTHRSHVSWPPRAAGSMSIPPTLEGARGTSPGVGGLWAAVPGLPASHDVEPAENDAVGGVHLHAAADRDPVTILCSSSLQHHTQSSPRLSTAAACAKSHYHSLGITGAGARSPITRNISLARRPSQLYLTANEESVLKHKLVIFF